MIRFAKLFAGVALSVACAIAMRCEPVQLSAVSSQSSETIASRIYYPEVRLRKMHLVRPDLILYPVFYDVFC